MALTLGAQVRYLSVVPHGDSRGRVCYAPGNLVEVALVTLASLIEWPGEIPEWPIATPQTGDEGELRAIIEELELTESQYRKLVILALEISASKAYMNLMVGVTGLLDYRPVLDAGLLDRIVAISDRRIHD
jgi:hypothetical protein